LCEREHIKYRSRDFPPFGQICGYVGFLRAVGLRFMKFGAGFLLHEARVLNERVGPWTRSR